MPKIVDKPLRREEIARTAMALFARDGFENTPIRAIAAKAGIGKGTFYDYFSDKEDILNEIVQIIFTDWTAMMATKLCEVSDPLEQLAVLLKEGSTLGDSFQQLMILYMDTWRRSVSRKASDEFIHTFRSLLVNSKRTVAGMIEAAQSRGLIRKELDAGHLATAMIALVDGMSLHHMILRTEFDADAVCDTFFEGFLSGLRP